MNSLLALAALFAGGMVAVHGNLGDLQRMITETTGRPAVLHYAFYGCCQQHDACYDGLLRHRCDAKREHYRYDQGSWCAQLSCECDRSLALCLRRSLGTYRARYRFYPKHACRH
nr:PREDICTED: group IID secretory phospholipase A2-like [Apteryx mantelli mantelli]